MATKSSSDDATYEPLYTAKQNPFARLIESISIDPVASKITDITMEVNHLSKHMTNPTRRHQDWAKRALRDILGTMNLTLTINRKIST
jgi:hypothetical protein